ncbi:MAG: radical SAM protein [Kiritimatiellaeota bacterium]|nr:radical SAM protein [Kiritimatiellota bacterium]
MDTQRKLEILSQDAQYDLACACGSSERDRRTRGTGGKWLYPVTLPSGGYSLLLKTLVSNACSNDCKYCPLRRGANVARCSLTPDEIANIFLEYRRTQHVFGLFLTSGVTGTPDRSMERLLDTTKLLRRKHQFRGYIHLKILPGASDAAVEEAVRSASAVSLNIETPGRHHFAKLSECKDYDRDIIRPLTLMSRLTARGQTRARVKCTTQFVVGASDETDAEIVKYMEGLYERLKFDRIYFSAYQPGLGDPSIPGEQALRRQPGDALLRREHRLYQTDFLLRKYGFTGKELIFDAGGNLALDRDPKETWAHAHPEFFPVRANTADREKLLRVPGLGLLGVARLLAARQQGTLRSLAGAGLRGRLAAKAAPYLVWT